MLHIMRKHSKSWGIKVVFGIIIAVFVLWGGYAYHSLRDTAVAQIDDHYISRTEYQTEYDNMVNAYRQQLGGAFSDELIRKLDVKHQALESLIRRYLVMKGANALGFSASAEEIRHRILEFPVFLNDGKFEQGRYEAVLRQMRMSPEMFEQQIADEITIKKVQAFIKDLAVVTDQEALNDYHFNRDQIKLAYILIDPKSFEDRVAVQDDALQDFYQKNTNRYMEPEKREISYVLLNPEEIGKDIPVSDADIKTYYDDHLGQFSREQEVRARHILFKLKQDASPKEVEKTRAEAQKVLDEARKGKDFAELARKYSQDEATAPKGGDLNYFTKKQMTPIFADAAFAMKAGDISNLVRTSFGFHIIKVEDIHPARTAPLEEVKGDIIRSIRLERAQDIAFNKSRDLRDQAYARKDIERAAQELQLPPPSQVWIQLGPEQTEADPFSAQVKAKLFTLGQGEISDVVDTPKGLAVAQLKTVKAPRAIPFEQVKDRATKDYKAEQAKVLARQEADKVLKAAQEKNDLDAVAGPMKLTVRQSALFSRQDPDKDLKLLRGESLNFVFDLSESRPFPSAPLELGNRFVVCRLLVKNPAPQPSPEDLAGIAGQILQEKQAAVWESWLADVRRNAKIVQLREI